MIKKKTLQRTDSQSRVSQNSKSSLTKKKLFANGGMSKNSINNMSVIEYKESNTLDPYASAAQPVNQE